MEEELPAILPNEGLVEAVAYLLEERKLALLLAKDNEDDRTGIVDIGKGSGLVPFFAHNYVHSNVVLSGLHARSYGLERDFVEHRGVAISTGETAYEVDVVA